MTRDDIIRMAREAGAVPSGDPREWDVWLFQGPAMENFAALVAAEAAAHENEACAKVIDEIAQRREYKDWGVLRDAAFAIRNRGKA